MKKLVKLSFILVILLAILFSCKTQKSSVEYKYTTDTLIVSKTNTIYQAVRDTTFIENPCDSLGILNRFYAKIAIPFGQVVIKNEKGRINAIVNTDKLQMSRDSVIKYHTDYQTITKQIVKYRIPSWIIYTLIIETLLIALYVFLRVRKFIII